MMSAREMSLRRWAGNGPLPRSAGRARCRGVSLIEVIVSIGLLAVALSTITQFMFRATSGTAMAGRRAQGAFLAQERLETLLGHRDSLAAWESRVKREFKLDADTNFYLFKEPRYAAFRWSWDIAPVEGQGGLREVVVRTYWRRPHSNEGWAQCELRTRVAVPSPVRTAGVSTSNEESAL